MKHVTIPHLLQYLAAQMPNAIAIQGITGVPLSYDQLYAQLCATSAALRQLGIGHQDRVAVALPNGPTMAAAFLALAASTTCAPLNPAYRTPEFDHYLEDLQPKALILLQNSFSPARAVAQSRNIPILELQPTPARGAGSYSLHDEQGANLTENNQWGELRWAAPTDIALVLHTSGTTARPKIVPLTHQNLCRSAANIVQTLGLSAQDCCLNVMPLFHIHGLVASLLSTLAVGGRIVCTPGFAAENFFSWLEQFQPTWYSAVPTIHQAVLEQVAHHPDLLAQHHLRLIRSSSAALPPPVMAALEQSFGVPVIEAYGMTEAAHQMASNPLPPAQRKAGSVGKAAGPEIAIMDEVGNLLPQGAIGEVVIRGQNVTLGYDNNPTANAQSFTQGWFRTGDQGLLDADGYLYLQGRLKEIINRGGEKIVPQEVDNVLLELAGIRQAVTFAVPHPTLGFDVATAVVLQPVFQLSPAEIRSFLFDRLADFKVPSQVAIVTEIPKGATGKLQRIGLAEKLQAHLKSIPVAPQTEVEKIVAAVFSSILKIEEIGIHDNFFALGGDSLQGTQVANRLSAHWEIDLPNVEIFRKPTIAELAPEINRLIASLSQNISQFLPIQRRSDDQYLPLSFAQQRMWFLQQLEPESRAYQIPQVLRLQGSLNIEALQQALQAIVERHESLRTTFIVVDGQPIQVVTPAVDFELPLLDLSGQEPSQQRSQLSAALQNAANRAFDLANDLMLQATLIRLSHQEHMLQIVMHHIAADGWSRGVFTQELSALYQAFTIGQPNPLAPLPIQYADFARWQREWLSGKVLDTQLEYWKQQLSGAPPLLELPTDYPRPVRSTFQGADCCFQLSPALTHSLQQLSQETGNTLFMTLLAAFNTLLYRYTHQTDIIVGSPIANRQRVEVEELIGFFANTLVLRNDLSGNPSFRTLLERVRQVALNAYAHQDLPFEKLVEELQPERNLSSSPFFQVMFVLQNVPKSAQHLGNLSIESVRVESRTAQFDLTLTILEDVNGLKGVFEYNTNLFEAATIERMVGHFQTLLEDIVTNPGQRLSDLALLTATERHQLLVEWNNTQADYPKDKCIHQLFEEQVERTPDAIAVVFEDRQLTYRELNNRANRLAHYLHSLGVGPDVLVGICVERSLEMIVALLAILKAGGAYIPLDPSYPQDRLAFMLEDSQTLLLLTTEKILHHSLSASGTALLERIDNNERLTVIYLNQTWEIINQENPKSNVKPTNLAYILYTSGSTGKPKGVTIEHHSIVNFINWAQTVFNPEQLAGVLASTSICFDLSVFELFVPLASGGKVIIAENALHLPTLKASKDVTLINTVPSAIFELLRANSIPSSIQTVNLAGEPLSSQLVQQIYQLQSIAQVFNLYGPSETTTYSTYTLVSKDSTASPTIGTPIANTQIYILDSHHNPVPKGVLGEIYIGGEGLARGYLNLPELTQEKFVPHPWSDRPDAKLYKTGDLARYKENGNIEYLGRIDHQVKIRGFRIELGEIESALTQHPAVQQAVVIDREDELGDKRLVTYVVTAAGKLPTPGEFRQFLQQTLPEYMIPSAFVQLESLPMTPNGKVDRRALPKPDASDIQTAAAYAAPRNSAEQQLADIWAEVLKLEQVGIYDNFFELGGHSLLATQVISQLRRACQIELPLRNLFESPTVAELAKQIEAIHWLNGTEPASLKNIISSDREVLEL